MDLPELAAPLWFRGMVLTPCLLGGAWLAGPCSLMVAMGVVGATSTIVGVGLEGLRGDVRLSPLIMLLIVANLPAVLAHRVFVQATSWQEHSP